MTAGETIYDLVYEMINTTIYSSAAGPDVDNYAKIIYQDPGMISAIDAQLEKLGISETEDKITGGDGEFENALAEMVDGDWTPYADAAMSDEEYSKYMDNETSKPPTLDPISEKEGTGLISAGVGAARNPMSVLGPLVATMPHAALVLLALALAPLIVSELKKPGSMLDVRWRRIMSDEFNALMTRQDQWNAQIGVRQVYVQSHDQFLIMNGAAFTESNLRRVRESDDRIADRLEFTDHAKEFFK